MSFHDDPAKRLRTVYYFMRGGFIALKVWKARSLESLPTPSPMI